MRRLPRAAAILACAVLLAGCGGAPEASAPPPASEPSSTTAGKKGPDELLESPEPAFAETKDGARAFLLEYIERLNDASETGETAPLSAMDDGSCDSCRNVQEAIDDIYANGGTIEGGTWEPRVVEQLERPDGWVIDLEITFEPQSILRERDGKPDRYAGGASLASFILKWSDASWVIDEWTRAS